MTTFKEVDEARYDEMLGVLLPAFWIDRGFLVGEPFNHRRCKATGQLHRLVLRVHSPSRKILRERGGDDRGRVQSF